MMSQISVFDPFHWVFSEEKERKERKRKRLLWGIHFLCSLIFIYGQIIISIISISVHYNDFTISRGPALLTKLCSAVLPIVSLHSLTSTFLARHLGKVGIYCYLDSSPSKIAAVFAAFSYGFPFPCGNVWLCMAGNFWLADNCVAVYSTIL
jgi:hypothetical protein